MSLTLVVNYRYVFYLLILTVFAPVLDWSYSTRRLFIVSFEQNNNQSASKILHK